MSITVIKAGIADSIQDSGRFGFQHLGINPTGVMDRFSMQLANALVGNEVNEAVLEVHFPASVFLFSEPTILAIAGAEFSASINGEAVPNHHCIIVNKNDALQFHQPIAGTRAYLAVKGGFHVTKWLDSYSTNIKAGVGGYQGRTLKKGDEIMMNNTTDFSLLIKNKKFLVLPWTVDVPALTDKNEIFVIRGSEWDELTNESKAVFTETPFLITPQADRMGYRLENQPLYINRTEELLSSAVNYGTIQLLPDGKLIVLMAGHQTSGGYPRVANVISAHLHLLAQLRSGNELYFRLTDIETAEALFIKQQQLLLQLQNACTFRLHEYFEEHRH